jgi:hypothetical protein
VPLRDGGSLREALLSVQRQLNRTPPELEGPPLPAAAQDIWAVFHQIAAGRGLSAQGFPVALTNTEILSWSILRERRLTEWGLETIRRLDGLYVGTMARGLRELMQIKEG